MRKRKLGIIVFFVFCALVLALMLGLYLIPSARWMLTFLTASFLTNQENLPYDLEKTLKNLENPNYLQPQGTGGQQAPDFITPGLNSTSNSSGVPGQESNPAQIQSGVPGQESNPAQIQNEIEKYYLSQLETTARTYEGKLNNLVAQGYNEYGSYKNQGKKVPVTSLARKYLSAGSALEAECDASFYTILNRFRENLKLYSLPTEIVDRAEEEYKKTKANRKRQLLSKAMQL